MSAVIQLCILLILNFIALRVFADADCNKTTTTKGFYDCTLQIDPSYQSSVLTKRSAQASRDAITKWPNPKLEAKSISGENAGENVGSTELSLSLSISDLLVKRPALSKSGRSEEKLKMVEGEESEFKSKTQLIKDLYRYRQIQDELELVNEAIAAFKKIEKQFRSRSARGPEQDITLSLVELAQGDYQLQKNHLAVELNEILVKYKGILGSGFAFKDEWLPQLRQAWPNINQSLISKYTFELRKFEAEKEKREAEKNLACAEAWPNIEAGPVIERSTEGPTQFTSTGFSLSVDVPVFNWNGGARALSRANYEKAKLNYEYTLRKADLERDLLIQKFTSAVESLKESTSSVALKKKHDQIDGLFRQGLTSSTTVIEAHRQISEFTESRHEHELVALESLMYIYQLSGLDPSEVLK